jgi:2',3'-cyclic-nucleotide 2'-phosphodiesterase (5'-nucleotidase family)
MRRVPVAVRRLAIAVFLMSMLPAPAPCTGVRESGFVVYYTSSLNGNLDGCSCVSHPRAGLVKRAAYLRTLADRADAVLVDAGDVFDALPDDLAPGIILDVYDELGYDAVGVGDQELANGAAALLAMKASHPLLSNNLSLCPTADACRIFSPAPIVLQRRSGSVGVCALVDPEVFALYPERTNAEVKVAEVRGTAEMLLQKLEREEVSLAILLFHGSLDAAERLAREVPWFDLIVVGHEQRLLEPLRVGSTLIVSPGEEGNRLGRIEIEAGRAGVVLRRNAFRLFSYDKDPDDPPTRARITAYREALQSRMRK